MQKSRLQRGLRATFVGLAVNTVLATTKLLAGIVGRHRFTLYEYFITDKVGHSQDMQAARSVIANLARMIRSLLTKLDLNRTTVIITSDHGNIEDLSLRNHTLNAVPTIVWGAKREEVASRVRRLADITPAIVQILAGKRDTL